MNCIVLSFIGKLPNYILDCIYQIRIYSNVKIYIIIDDHDSEIVNKIKEYDNVEIVDYDNMTDYCNNLKKFKPKIRDVPNLKGREKLFYRSFERFYLLYCLMIKKEEKNVLFMEIDNLLYDDPNNWIKYIDKDIAFLMDNVKRVSTGICYVKTKEILFDLITFFDNVYFILNVSKEDWLNEMSAVYDFYELNKDKCFILPSYINDKYIKEICENFNIFNSLFDPSTYGIYLLGRDVFHTHGVLTKHLINPFGIIKQFKIEWKIIDGFKKPYFIHNNSEILINNLHVHSKDLINGVSK